MKYMTVTKEHALELVREFVEEDLRNVCASFLSSAHVAEVFRADAVVVDAEGLQVRGFLLERVVAAIYEFVETGRWTDGDPEEFEAVFEDFVFFEFPPRSRCMAGVDRSPLRTIWERYKARIAISPLPGYGVGEEGVSIREVALFGDLAEETVRVSTYAKGESRLCVGSSPYIVSRDEAERWLRLKNRFIPSRMDIPHEYSPSQLLASSQQFCLWFRASAEHLGFDLQDVMEKLPASERFTQVLGSILASEGGVWVDAGEWLAPEAAASLGKIFKVDPAWIARSAFSISHEKRIAEMLERIPAAFAASIPCEENSLGNEDVPLTRELARRVLTEWPGLHRHPLQKKANTKMDGYLLPDGGTLAHEHELKKQYLWMSANRSNPVLAGLEARHYSRVSQGPGVYGRHSGLKKYPDISRSDVVRVHVKTIGTLKKVLAELV